MDASDQAQLAERRVGEILRAAERWAGEAPAALSPAITAVTVRLAELLADPAHYRLAGTARAQEETLLAHVAAGLRATGVTGGIEEELRALTERELRSTGSWASVPGATGQWSLTATGFLGERAEALPEAERPDPWWADDVVAGITASVRAIVGIDELHARTEAQFEGMPRSDEVPPEG